MVSASDVRTVFGIIGNIISVSRFLSPLPTFILICRRGSVEQFSPMPYLAIFINCLVWCLYGLVHPNSTLVITINGAGVIIELSFLILFFIFSDLKLRRIIFLALLLEIVFAVGIAVYVLKFFHPYEKRSMVVGSIGVFFSSAAYMAPLSIMKTVIKTKSVEYMPLSLSLASFFDAICWATYALLRFDFFLTIPNCLGTMFALSQLILYAIFYKSSQLREEERREEERREEERREEERREEERRVEERRVEERREEERREEEISEIAEMTEMT